jgi:hypothetical protein
MMKYCFSALVLVVALGIAAPRASAQATATATGRTLAVGLSYQNSDPDYGPSRSSGVGIFANYDVSRHLGATAEMNFQTAFSNVVFLEHVYLVGARGLYNRGRYIGYAKFLVGGATASNNAAGGVSILNAPGSYPVVAYGGGLEIRFEHHFTLRAIDYEQQQWLRYHPNGLTPGVFSFGGAYRF